ncbi:hypothetical protein II941_03205 [bacterium]|nr:hypothetical protein [bacterium]
MINHRTKEIGGRELSKTNDTQLIINSFAKIKDKSKCAIIHSDYGVC